MCTVYMYYQLIEVHVFLNALTSVQYSQTPKHNQKHP